MPKPPNSSKWPSSPSSVWPITSRRSKPRGKSSQPRSRQQGTSARTSTKRSSTGSGKNRRNELLRKLGIDRQSIDDQAQITPILKQCGILPARVIEVLRVDQDDLSREVTRIWDSWTPGARRILGLEALAVAAGTTPRRLWELYAGATMTQSRESVGVMIADALPSIMRVVIRKAKTTEGYTAQEQILKSARVLPVPKGSTTNINVGGPKELEEGDDNEPEGGIMANSDDFLMQASRAMSPHALPAPQILPPEDEDEDGV